MKKLISYTLVLAFIGMFGFASSAIASEDVLGTGEITIGANSTELIIGLSPKVTARYICPGTTDATSQWFSIATAHPGGNTLYGTAQNLNNIDQQDFETGTALDNSVLDIPASANSASDWSTNGWKM